MKAYFTRLKVRYIIGRLRLFWRCVGLASYGDITQYRYLPRRLRRMVYNTPILGESWIIYNMLKCPDKRFEEG